MVVKGSVAETEAAELPHLSRQTNQQSYPRNLPTVFPQGAAKPRTAWRDNSDNSDIRASSVPEMFRLPIWPMSRLRSLQDFLAAGLDTIAECKGCGRRVRVDTATVLRAQPAKWRTSLEHQGSRLRCTVCEHRGARLAPAPKIVGPLDCDEFKADIERMWERVVADEASDAPFKIEGPDADGFVWVCSPEGRDVWCHNLGTEEQAAAVMSQWLGSIDYQEND